MTIDLNCDMGEGMSNDEAIMPYISSANIACGYHAGDESTIRKTIELCLLHKVAIGAHPGFDDKENFGRKPVYLSHEALYQLVWRQLEIMQTICTEMNARLHHVKLHGALYNQAAKDRVISTIAAQAVKDFDSTLVYYGLSGSVMLVEAQALELQTAHEAFADRTYQPDGTLTPRTQGNALLRTTHDVVSQVLQITTQRTVTTVSGVAIPMMADTICIHGDGDHALDFSKHLHRELIKRNFKITAIRQQKTIEGH